jgi:benzoyl-CoA reductase/2-hydroxyglutaryl-CoA dehydratase subunit BcrC/BadD/HgdB
MTNSILPPALPDPLPVDRSIGITTTVPVEVILAAGLVPVDLNNVFVTAADPLALVAEAERAGFPRTCCCWTKGIYGAVRRHGVKRVIGVTQGDCSNTHALMEVLRFEGVECIPFEFPYQPDPPRLEQAIRALGGELGAGLAEAELWRVRLAGARQRAAEIDRLSWQECRVSGRENHLWLVSTSDFCADPGAYEHEAGRFLAQAAARQPVPHRMRLGYVGVPPIAPEIYEYLESVGGLVLYNETQRQFAMPGGGGSLAEQYSRYTYPYGIFARIEDVRRECQRRALDGIVHYVQSFCFRRIEDRILRETVRLPVLTIECDRPGPLSGQIKTRLEAFVQMLQARKEGRAIF